MSDSTTISSSDRGYDSDIAPDLAFKWLQTNQASLVDVRSEAEHTWVGVIPGAILIPWKTWPGMTLNPNFEHDLLKSVSKTQKIMFLCRSGIRSIAAAKLATQLGYTASNILGGFEGDLNEHSHRNHLNGWRHANLPWLQS